MQREAKFKEFKSQLKFKMRLRISQRSIETGFWEF